MHLRELQGVKVANGLNGIIVDMSDKAGPPARETSVDL